jgi:hypothetical protein
MHYTQLSIGVLGQKPRIAHENSGAELSGPMHPKRRAERHLHQVFGRIAAQGHEVVYLRPILKGRWNVNGGWYLVIRRGGDLFFQITVIKILRNWMRSLILISFMKI